MFVFLLSLKHTNVRARLRTQAPFSCLKEIEQSLIESWYLTCLSAPFVFRLSSSVSSSQNKFELWSPWLQQWRDAREHKLLCESSSPSLVHSSDVHGCDPSPRAALVWLHTGSVSLSLHVK